MVTRPILPDGVDEVDLHRRMILARRFDERAIEKRVDGSISGPVHPYLGQEAVAVGMCAHLRDTDRITSTHRGHGHCIAKGADPRRMMAELFGRVDGYCHGLGGSMHIADFDIGMLGANGIVAAGLPIAAGAALAAQLDGHDSVAVCFFGDGAVGAGPFHEVLNIAALWKLPIIFLCENNSWAAGTPIERGLAGQTPHEFGEAYGIPHEAVDGNDLLAVLEAAGRAVAHARAGQGPFLLEAVTFRMSPHAMRDVLPPDDRDVDTLRAWTERDPITLHAAAMLDRGIVDEETLASLRKDADECVEDAIQFAESSPYPTMEIALEGLFAS